MQDIINKIQEDLENGKFNRICSNETTFLDYITERLTESYYTAVVMNVKNKTIDEVLEIIKDGWSGDELEELISKLK